VLALSLVTAPVVEPLTVAEAKQHLRIEDGAHDTELGAMIVAARKLLEETLWRAFITQTWDYWLDAFPPAHLALPRPPLQSITSISYTDTDGAEQTVDGSLYGADTATDPGRVILADGESWPTSASIPKAVKVRFVAGYGDAASAVPAPLIAALKLELELLYDRPDEAYGRVLASRAKALAAPYSVRY
jgi:uncharacterized phiE125 gp8 family phage protein